VDDLEHYRNVAASLVAAADDDPTSPLYTLLVHAANTINELCETVLEDNTIRVVAEDGEIVATITPPQSTEIMNHAISEYIHQALELAVQIDRTFGAT
jgi:hypothetical protein